eukprot:gene7807-12281_t
MEKHYIPESITYTVLNHYSSKSTIITAKKEEIEATLKEEIFKDFSTLNENSIYYYLAYKISENDYGKGKFIDSMDSFKEIQPNFIQYYQGTKKFDFVFSWSDEEDSSNFVIEMWVYTNNTIQYNFNICFEQKLKEPSQE